MSKKNTKKSKKEVKHQLVFVDARVRLLLTIADSTKRNSIVKTIMKKAKYGFNYYGEEGRIDDSNILNYEIETWTVY